MSPPFGDPILPETDATGRMLQDDGPSASAARPSGAATESYVAAKRL